MTDRNSDDLLPGHREIAPGRAAAVPMGLGLILAAIGLLVAQGGGIGAGQLVVTTLAILAGLRLVIGPQGGRRIPHD